MQRFQKNQLTSLLRFPSCARRLATRQPIPYGVHVVLPSDKDLTHLSFHHFVQGLMSQEARRIAVFQGTLQELQQKCFYQSLKGRRLRTLRRACAGQLARNLLRVEASPVVPYLHQLQSQ